VTITVLVPDEHGVDRLSGVDGIRPLRYALDEPLPEGADEANVLVPGFLSKGRELELVPKLPGLEYVQLLSAGAELWIGQVPERILLSTCRGAHNVSTAELVVGGLIGVYREFGQFAADQRAARWNQHRTDTLQGKRALIVGAGDIGEAIATRLNLFDTATTMVGRTKRDGVHGVDELPQLLGDHHIVVVVVPLTSATTKLVDAEFLARMPDDAVLVNAARGPVVDTDALVAELDAGRLRAVLDVTDPEPLPSDHPLWRMPGLVLFPHQGGTCTGHEDRAWKIAAEEIIRFSRGERPRNLVRGEY
jgi:phosphoglycerate dehydrogenase-like enzyme